MSPTERSTMFKAARGFAAVWFGSAWGCLPFAMEGDAGVGIPDAAYVDAGSPDASFPDAGMLRFRHQWDELTLCAIDLGVQPVAGCCADRVELPQLASTVLDLRHLRTGLTGTCGDPIKIRLPAEPEAYPLKLLLPAVPSVDPHCGRACGGRTPSTAFGVVLELPPSLVDAYRPSIVAPPPWKFVYDHNSLAGDACLGGYQEFGQRACVRTNYGGAIGFATETAPLPSLVALIDIQPGVNGAVQNCCPYLP